MRHMGTGSSDCLLLGHVSVKIVEHNLNTSVCVGEHN